MVIDDNQNNQMVWKRMKLHSNDCKYYCQHHHHYQKGISLKSSMFIQWFIMSTTAIMASSSSSPDPSVSMNILNDRRQAQNTFTDSVAQLLPKSIEEQIFLNEYHHHHHQNHQASETAANNGKGHTMNMPLTSKTYRTVTELDGYRDKSKHAQPNINPVSCNCTNQKLSCMQNCATEHSTPNIPIGVRKRKHNDRNIMQNAAELNVKSSSVIFGGRVSIKNGTQARERNILMHSSRTASVNYHYHATAEVDKNQTFNSNNSNSNNNSRTTSYVHRNKKHSQRIHASTIFDYIGNDPEMEIENFKHLHIENNPMKISNTLVDRSADKFITSNVGNSSNIKTNRNRWIYAKRKVRSIGREEFPQNQFNSNSVQNNQTNNENNEEPTSTEIGSSMVRANRFSTSNASSK